MTHQQHFHAAISCVEESLGAEVITVHHCETLKKDDGYVEYAFYVLWKRGDHVQQHGSHRVCVNSSENLAIWGHYYDNSDAAKQDFLRRSGLLEHDDCAFCAAGVADNHDPEPENDEATPLSWVDEQIKTPYSKETT